MAWSFSSDKAVYLQISERITKAVLSGKYAPGEQIPTVRQLALEAAVNPNTVQRAFSELENQGIIISKGTVGRYVTDDSLVLERCRKAEAKALIESFAKNAKELGVSKEEIFEILKEELI